MIAAKLIMTIIPITYIIVVVILWGVQKSISDSYYRYKDYGKWKYMFTLFCWSLAYPALILSPTPIMFGAFILLGVTGASPAFKDDKIVKTSHMIGAYGGVILSQVSIAVDHRQYLVNVLFVVLSVTALIFRKKINHIWWIEIFAILSIYKVLIF